MVKYPEVFTEALCVKTLIDVVNAMKYLHEHRIIHRDLKPDNILMLSLNPNSTVVAKVSDFGTTRDVSNLTTRSNLTRCIGTPLFMAPEMIKGEKYDRSVDVYSFSLVVYTLFARKLPYENEFPSAWSVSSAVVLGKRPDIPKDCPDDIVRMMIQCWDADPSKRPSFAVIDDFLCDYFILNC